MLGDYIKKMAHHAAVDNVGTYGNNFVTLRALNHLLRFMLFEEDKDRELAYTFLNHSLKWQFEDGIFYDFPRSFNDEKGIPSLAYHSKITFITLLFGVISGDKGRLFIMEEPIMPYTAMPVGYLPYGQRQII